MDDTTLYTVFYDELDGLDRSVLAKSVNAVHGFCGSMNKLCKRLMGYVLTVFDSGVPPTVHEIDARGFRQVERDTTSLQGHQENSHMDIGHCKFGVRNANMPTKPFSILKCWMVASRA